MMKSNILYTIALLATMLVALGACGGGGGTTPTEPMETAYEMALDAIQTAETAAEAQEAYDAVDKNDVTGTEAAQLMAALQKRRDDLATMARIAEQKMALANAVAAVDTSDLTTREEIADANSDILALEMALAGATDLSDADKMGAQSTLTAAKSAVSTATAALDLSDRQTAQSDDLSMKATALQTALDGLSGTPTESEIASAQAALDALNASIEAAQDLNDAAKVQARLTAANAQGTINNANKVLMAAIAAEEARKEEEARKAVEAKAEEDRKALENVKNAVAAAETAVEMVDDDADADTVTAAEKAVETAETAIAGATNNVGEDLRNSFSATVAQLKSRLDEAKESRDKKLADDQKAKEANDAAMAATAAKLHAGISAPTGDAGTPGANDRAAAYNNDASAIMVSIGDGTTAPAAPATGLHTLSEDKKATVAANHGWEGKRYADPAGGDMVEAVVYSNVGMPTMGAKFNSGATDLPQVGDLDGTSGETGVLSGLTGYAALVDSPSFDQPAGTKEFKLPTNAIRVMLSGTYYGVSGTYYCTPAADSTCAARRAATGFELGSTLDATNAFTAGGWTFKPSNPKAKVMSTPDSTYASYGWWLHKADDGTYTASAFDDDRGTVTPAAGITVLQGTATYEGGAAGKYALSSSTGGTNDAGHFTARATLEADFSKNVSATGITGTIDQFVGADGNARNWEVELMGSAISAGGLVRALNADGTTEPAETDAGAKTKWTINGTAGTAAGGWTGTLMDNGDDGVPKVATGTFHSTHGPGNSMVGAFGVNKQ